MQMVKLPGGEQVPALGQGTWLMGERARDRAEHGREPREAKQVRDTRASRHATGESHQHHRLASEAGAEGPQRASEGDGKCGTDPGG